jgi:chromate transporter
MRRWLSAGQMLDGLGLAETIPGPLIMVTQFVGFLGGWNHPGQLPPLLAATIGALVTTWTTFTPCFLWIFLGGPYIEKCRALQLSRSGQGFLCLHRFVIWSIRRSSDNDQ